MNSSKSSSSSTSPDSSEEKADAAAAEAKEEEEQQRIVALEKKLQDEKVAAEAAERERIEKEKEDDALAAAKKKLEEEEKVAAAAIAERERIEKEEAAAKKKAEEEEAAKVVAAKIEKERLVAAEEVRRLAAVEAKVKEEEEKAARKEEEAEVAKLKKLEEEEVTRIAAQEKEAEVATLKKLEEDKATAAAAAEANAKEEEEARRITAKKAEQEKLDAAEKEESERLATEVNEKEAERLAAIYEPENIAEESPPKSTVVVEDDVNVDDGGDDKDDVQEQTQVTNEEETVLSEQLQQDEAVAVESTQPTDEAVNEDEPSVPEPVSEEEESPVKEDVEMVQPAKEGDDVAEVIEEPKSADPVLVVDNDDTAEEVDENPAADKTNKSCSEDDSDEDEAPPPLPHNVNLIMSLGGTTEVTLPQDEEEASTKEDEVAETPPPPPPSSTDVATKQVVEEDTSDRAVTTSRSLGSWSEDADRKFKAQLGQVGGRDLNAVEGNAPTLQQRLASFNKATSSTFEKKKEEAADMTLEQRKTSYTRNVSAAKEAVDASQKSLKDRMATFQKPGGFYSPAASNTPKANKAEALNSRLAAFGEPVNQKLNDLKDGFEPKEAPKPVRAGSGKLSDRMAAFQKSDRIIKPHAPHQAAPKVEKSFGKSSHQLRMEKFKQASQEPSQKTAHEIVEVKKWKNPTVIPPSKTVGSLKDRMAKYASKAAPTKDIDSFAVGKVKKKEDESPKQTFKARTNVNSGLAQRMASFGQPSTPKEDDNASDVEPTAKVNEAIKIDETPEKDLTENESLSPAVEKVIDTPKEELPMEEPIAEQEASAIEESEKSVEQNESLTSVAAPLVVPVKEGEVEVVDTKSDENEVVIPVNEDEVEVVDSKPTKDESMPDEIVEEEQAAVEDTKPVEDKDEPKPDEVVEESPAAKEVVEATKEDQKAVENKVEPDDGEEEDDYDDSEDNMPSYMQKRLSYIEENNAGKANTVTTFGLGDRMAALDNASKRNVAAVDDEEYSVDITLAVESTNTLGTSTAGALVASVNNPQDGEDVIANDDYLYDLYVKFEELKSKNNRVSVHYNKMQNGDVSHHEPTLEEVMAVKCNTRYTANNRDWLNQEWILNHVHKGCFKLGDPALFKQFDKTNEKQRDKIIRTFVKNLRKYANDIRELDLSSCLLPDKFLEDLSEAILRRPTESFPKLQLLNVESNMLRGPGIESISKAIANKSALKYLQVVLLENQKHSMSSSAERALVDAVRESTSIVICSVTLRDGFAQKDMNDAILRNNDQMRLARRDHQAKEGTLSPRKRTEMEIFFDNIANNEAVDTSAAYEEANKTHITEVDIVGDQKFLSLTEEEKIHTGSAFMTNDSVTSVQMNNLVLDDHWAEAFGESIAINNTIVKVNIDSNAFTGKGIKDLFEGLAENETIEDFQVRHQKKPMASVDEEALYDLLAANMSIIKLGVDIRNPLVKSKLEGIVNANRDRLRKQRNAAKKAAGGNTPVSSPMKTPVKSTPPTKSPSKLGSLKKGFSIRKK